MIITEEQKKLILQALVYMIKAAYTDEEIKEASNDREEVFGPILIAKKRKLRALVKLVYLLKNGR